MSHSSQLRDCSRRAPLSRGPSRQEHWSGLPGPHPGDLPNPVIKPVPVESPALADGFSATELPGKPACTSLFVFFTLMVYHRMLDVARWAPRLDLVPYPSCIRSSASANPKPPVYPSPLPPLGSHKPVPVSQISSFLPLAVWWCRLRVGSSTSQML